MNKRNIKKDSQSENNVTSTAELEAEKITKLTFCGKLLSSELHRNCVECGPRLIEQVLEYSLVGSDVKTLFPSITSKK